MALRINDVVPDFTADSSEGPISFHEWIGDSYAILFSHPKDFTPVCTTEFGAVAQLADEWAERNTKVIGVSVDGVADHKKWKEHIEQIGGAKVTFPILADKDLKISKAFDMLPAEFMLPDAPTPKDSETVRVVYIIGPDKKVRLMMTYPMFVGRNFGEILRALDGVQLSDRAEVATPANWEVGQDVVIRTSVSNEDAKKRFGDFDEKLPYLRMTKMPA